MLNKHKLWSGLALVCLLAGVAIWWWSRTAPVPGELPRAALELRDGRMYPRDGGGPFTGIMFERASTGQRLTEVPLQDGIINGLARGWYDAGQLEVEEHFENGVSEGVRKRWHANGKLKNEAAIVKGELHGPYTEWHDNGQLAARLTMVHGRGEGLSEAWHPDGSKKAVVTLEAGKPVKQEFFPKQTGEVAGQ